ncbi:hypothetical protein [Saezia sanguinis]
MKDFLIWYCITVVLIGTGINYWVSGPDRSWSSGSSYSSGRSGSIWHK